MNQAKPTSRKFLEKGLWILVFGWILFIYGSYTYFQRGNILWESLGAILFRIFLLLVFLLVSAALGRKIFKWLKFENGSFLESFLFGLAIGLAIITYGIIGFGLAGLLNRWVINLFFVGMFALTYGEIGNIIHQIKDKFKALSLQLKIPSIETVLLIIIAIQIFFNLAGASVLPSGWDSLGEHLAKAKEWNRLHRLSSIPYINFDQWAQPFNIGILYAMALFLKDAILAQLIHFAFGLLTAVGVYALGKRYFSQRVGLISAAIFYTIPILVFMSTTAYIDLGFTFYAFFAFFAIVRWTSTGKKGWLLLSAIISGLALGSKYAGLPLTVILSSGILLGGWFVRKEKPLRVTRDFFIFLGLTGLIGSFWYVRAYIIGVYSIFDMWHGYLLRFWQAIKGIWAPEFLNLAVSQPVFALNLSLPKRVISLSWNVTMHSGRLAGYGAVGILFLAFLPFFLFPRFRTRKLMKFMLYYSGVYFVFWAALVPIKRYLMPILPLSGIMVGYMLEELSSFNRFFKYFFYTILVLTLLFNMFYLAPESLNMVYQRILVFAGMKSQEEHILKNEQTYTVFRYINENLPAKAKVWILNDPRTFYCDREYVTVAPHIYGLKDASEVLAELKSGGITHLVFKTNIRRDYYDRLREEFKKNHLELLYHEYPFKVFKIRY